MRRRRAEIFPSGSPEHVGALASAVSARCAAQDENWVRRTRAFMRKRMSGWKIGGADQLDAIVVGAGFAGLYALYKLRTKGLRGQILEAGKDIGGTWFWN